jgi:hypothetical protein
MSETMKTSTSPARSQNRMGVNENAIKAICEAIVLGEDEKGNPVHLSPEEARKAIDAYQSAQLPSSAPKSLEWQDMVLAPKDGTMLRLLVVPDQEEFTAFDDSLTPYETIGSNNLSDTHEDRWEFAGWDWQQDSFITGRGEVIGWMPFKAAVPSSLEEAIRWCLARDERNGSLPEAYAEKLRAALTRTASPEKMEGSAA